MCGVICDPAKLKSRATIEKSYIVFLLLVIKFKSNQKKESKKQTRTNDMWFSIAPGVVPIYEPVATATPIIETPLHCIGGGFIFSLLCTCVYFRVHLITYKYTCVISL